MNLGFDLTDLLREAEDDCPTCNGTGIRECQQCHGKGKILNHMGLWLVKFIARHSDVIAEVAKRYREFKTGDAYCRQVHLENEGFYQWTKIPDDDIEPAGEAKGASANG